MPRITRRLPLKFPLKFYPHNCNWPTNLYFRICWTNIFFEASCCNSSGKCDDKKSTPRITRGLPLQVPTKIGITQFQDLSRQIFALRPSVANICLVTTIHNHHVVLMLTDDDTSACWSFFWHRFFSAMGEACHPESCLAAILRLLNTVCLKLVRLHWQYLHSLLKPHFTMSYKISTICFGK